MSEMDAVRELVNKIRTANGLDPVLSAEEEKQAPPLPVCPVCGGSGWEPLGRDRDGYSWVKPCACVAVGQARQRIKQSGLSDLLEQCTFDSFKTREPWQQEMARTAARYADAVINGEKPWLFMGGQPGCGKTHLCTAICGKLLNAGKGVKYAQWTEAARELRGLSFDSTAFKNAIAPFMDAAVLYIDDLFKGQPGSKPSATDGALAFEILNPRYFQTKPTIISSEWTLSDLLNLDQGTFSRVRERAQGYIINIGADTGKNQRFA